MEYLDSRVGGGRLIPAAGIDRYACLTAAANGRHHRRGIADGL